jgi:hypothetical protein
MTTTDKESAVHPAGEVPCFWSGLIFFASVRAMREQRPGLV